MNKSSDAIQDIDDQIKKIISLNTPVGEFKKIIGELLPEPLNTILRIQGNWSLYHSIFARRDFQEEVEQRLKCVFENATRLQQDLNAQCFLPGAPAKLNWKNTPLHYYLSNERFDLVRLFLKFAKEFNFKVNLNLVDLEGKSPLLLAIKLGNAPLDVVISLLSPENYNQEEATGVTPLMMACVTRRVDIMQVIIQYHATQIGLGVLNFAALTKEQIQALASFVNQQDSKTSKSLAHFAVMRLGTAVELFEKPESYQLTVLNLLKSVSIDGRRDKNSFLNTPRNQHNHIICIPQQNIDFYDQNFKKKKEETVAVNQFLSKNGLSQFTAIPDLALTHLTYNGVFKQENALLAAYESAPILLLLVKRYADAKFSEIVIKQLRSYARVGYAASILQRSAETIEFLARVGLNFTLKQQMGNKTAADYVSNLKLTGNQHAVTPSDREHIFPLEERLRELAKSSLSTVMSERDSPYPT